MIPLRAVIRNKVTGEVIRWQLDCYNQKVTIRQINLAYFPMRGKDSDTEWKKVNDSNSTVIAEALIVDKVVEGVLFRGLHAAEWQNNYIIWSDIKNPNNYQMLKEFIFIQYKHLTKLPRPQFEVTIPTAFNPIFLTCL